MILLKYIALWLLAVEVGRVTARESCQQEKPVCVKTVREPYYERICTEEVACTKIEVLCGPPGERFSCAFDETCVRTQPHCSNETLYKNPSLCEPQFSCEWKPYWDVDLKLFSVQCTEFYTLLENETCADAMTKFFLPWKVFSGFNADLDCKEVEEGDKVCVHAVVEPKRPECGKTRCKIGETCSHTECYWKAQYGDRCGDSRCPLGYACHAPEGSDCKKTPAVTHGTYYFEVGRGPFGKISG